MSDFEPYRGKIRSSGDVPVPMVTVSDGRIYTNLILREELGHPDQVEFLVDDDGHRIGLRPDPDGEVHHAYALSNRSLNTKKLWTDLGVTVPESVPIEVDVESEDFPVIDIGQFVDGAESQPQSESQTADEDPEEEGEEKTDENPKTETATVLGQLSDVGPATENRLRERGYRSVEAVADASVSDLTDIPGVGDLVAKRMIRDAGGEPESETDDDDDEPILDHERVDTALESVGVPVDVAPIDFLRAVDANSQTFSAAQDLDGVARGDVADLIRRLDLEDALESDDGLAEARFESGEGGASA